MKLRIVSVSFRILDTITIYRDAVMIRNGMPAVKRALAGHRRKAVRKWSTGIAPDDSLASVGCWVRNGRPSYHGVAQRCNDRHGVSMRSAKRGWTAIVLNQQSV